MSREERAKQFMPFAALKGYEELVKEKDVIKEEKREPSEEEAAILSDTVSSLKKGDVVKVVYYNGAGYSKITGVCSGIDTVQRTIRIIKTLIPFSEILFIMKTPE